MKTKTKKWGISKVQPKQKRTYMTKKRKLLSIIGVMFHLGFQKKRGLLRKPFCLL